MVTFPPHVVLPFLESHPSWSASPRDRQDTRRSGLPLGLAGSETRSGVPITSTSLPPTKQNTVIFEGAESRKLAKFSHHEMATK